MCVCSVCLPVCVGGMAAERFINPVHQGSVGFTLRHQRLKDVSATQARQRLYEILIWALIFYHNNPPPSTPSAANTSTPALLPQLVDSFAVLLRRLSTTASILYHWLSIVIHPAEHCMFLIIINRAVWSLVYRTLSYITVNMELQGSVKGAADLNTLF